MPSVAQLECNLPEGEARLPIEEQLSAFSEMLTIVPAHALLAVSLAGGPPTSLLSWSELPPQQL
jgi:hypothetical protein